MFAISPTRTVNLCYTRISALHRKDSYLALPTVTIVCHNNSILAYSPLERLLPIPQDRSFNTHSNQYNDLRLEVSSSTHHTSQHDARLTHKYPCSALRRIHRFSAVYKTSALS